MSDIFLIFFLQQQVGYFCLGPGPESGSGPGISPTVAILILSNDLFDISTNHYREDKKKSSFLFSFSLLL